MTQKDIQVLGDAAQAAKVIQTGNKTQAEVLVKKINSAGYDGVQLGCISDVLTANTYDHVSEVHFYLLRNIADLPDRQALERVALAKRMFDASSEDRGTFLEERVTSEQMFTGHATDFLFCSILIRLALADRNYEMVEKIQSLLAGHGAPTEGD